jgi:dUTPase
MATANVVASIVPDSNVFLPTSNGNGGFGLKVSSKSEQMLMPPRSSCLLDCGLQITPPKGFRIIVEANASWAKKGLTLHYVDDEKRLLVAAHNVDKQILSFGEGDEVGTFYFVECAKVALKVQK